MSGPIRQAGFVGIGTMGWPMAANLVRAGFGVAVADAAPGRDHTAMAHFCETLAGAELTGPDAG